MSLNNLFLVTLIACAVATFFLTVSVEAGKELTTPSGLKIEFIQEGKGPNPKSGQKVTVHYTGTLMTGKKFDSSRDRNQPFTFALNAGEVIRGWDEAVSLLPIGSRAKVTIPPHLGYGPTGAGGVIPPNATLVFDIELISAK
ncbi:MAG: FKBP-type peptidyl-prolyl cis-trans isomerase [Syntrophaceae bacterium]|nr:FKBP-type peptidyl-prolyl cis-trans isomerase [Syntrophaceae bacterium]